MWDIRTAEPEAEAEADGTIVYYTTLHYDSGCFAYAISLASIQPTASPLTFPTAIMPS
jgi:hypothetical protein